jgi:hypothetical protein
MSTTETLPAVVHDPVVALKDQSAFDRLYAEMEREVTEHRPDLTTAGGRKAIASLAYKITRTKTAIDDAGKKLTEDARKEIAAVNETRGAIRTKLEALADRARQPLTDWEVAEKERVARFDAIVATLQAAGAISIDDTSETLAARLAKVEAIQITDEEFGDQAPGARYTWTQATEALVAGIERLKREEADRAELARLREQAAERERQGAERLAAERAEAAAAEAERQRQAEIAAAAERARQEEAHRAERQRVAAEEAAMAALRAQEEAHAAELARIQQENEAREAERVHQEQARQAEADRLAAEARRRQEDLDHRASVLAEIKAEFMLRGVNAITARTVILAIAKGEIPHIKVEF